MTLPSIARVLILAVVLAGSACSREPASAPAAPDSSAPLLVESRVVEAACGSCRFDLPGDDCALAVRIDGRALYVDGTKMDDLGDAHAADGLCNAVRKARVSGRVEGDRFRTTSFELLPVER